MIRAVRLAGVILPAALAFLTHPALAQGVGGGGVAGGVPCYQGATCTVSTISVTGLLQGGSLSVSGAGALGGPLTIGGPSQNALTLNPGATSSAAATLGVTGTGGVSFSVTGTQASAPIQINSVSVLNLLANQASPLLSPETSNAPSANALYLPAPIVNGYTETAGTSTYSGMNTVNLTVTGTVTNHWGQQENTINVGGGGDFNAELNVQKDYMLLASGTTLNDGEDYEAMGESSGTVSTWSDYIGTFYNDSGGHHSAGLRRAPDPLQRQHQRGVFRIMDRRRLSSDDRPGSGDPGQLRLLPFQPGPQRRNRQRRTLCSVP